MCVFCGFDRISLWKAAFPGQILEATGCVTMEKLSAGLSGLVGFAFRCKIIREDTSRTHVEH